jgi:hypothetical protein
MLDIDKKLAVQHYSSSSQQKAKAKLKKCAKKKLKLGKTSEIQETLYHKSSQMLKVPKTAKNTTTLQEEFIQNR